MTSSQLYYCLDQCCPVEFSVTLDVFYICMAQYVSHHTLMTNEYLVCGQCDYGALILLTLMSHMWLLAPTMDHAPGWRVPNLTACLWTALLHPILGPHCLESLTAGKTSRQLLGCHSPCSVSAMDRGRGQKDCAVSKITTLLATYGMVMNV